jgi:hypothetical protein
MQTTRIGTRRGAAWSFPTRAGYALGMVISAEMALDGVAGDLETMEECADFAMGRIALDKDT